MLQKNKIFGGILLLSGTAIGAGMLALPLATALMGFNYSLFTFLGVWIFMMLAAFLLLEVNLWFPGEIDLINMVGSLLGKFHKAIAWLCYLLLLYSVIAAYFYGTTTWILKILEETQIPLSYEWGNLIVAVVFGAIICFGTALTEKINRWFAIGLFLSCAILIALLLPNVKLSQIGFGQPSHIFLALPLIVTAFSSAAVLPSLTNYLNRDLKALKIILIVGGALPLILYLVWEFLSFGIIPLKGGICLENLIAVNDGTAVTLAMEEILGHTGIAQTGRAFAIFAILTSLLGASLALFHCLADALKIKPIGKNRLLLLIFTYLPPLLILVFFPTGFGRILSFAGIFVSLLFGIYPAIMVWVGRYHRGPIQKLSPYTLFGGRPLLFVIILFYVLVVIAEIVNCS